VTADHLLDDRTRRDIGGVVFAIVAVALLVMVFMPGNGVVAKAVSEWMRLLFGFGAYLLPFALLLVGASLVIRFDQNHMPARVAVGLIVMLVAIIGLLGVFTPGVTPHNLQALFLREHLLAQGGYLGAGIAWAGLSLFGQLVTIIILVGLIVISLLIIGFSISGLIEKAQDANRRHQHERAAKAAQRAVQEEQDAEAEEDGPSDPFADMPVGGQATRRFTDAESVRDQPTRVLHRRSQDTDQTREIDQEDEDGSAFESAAAAGIGFGSQRTQALGNAQDAVYAGRAADPQAMTRKLGSKSRVENELDDLAAKEKPAPIASGTKPKPRNRAKVGKPAPSAEKTKGAVAGAGKPSKAAKGGTAPINLPYPSENFELPPANSLKRSASRAVSAESEASLAETAQLLQKTLNDFGVDCKVVDWVAGPTVTLFQIALPSGVRVNRVTNLSDDIALALAAPGVRIFSPVPGTNHVGVEVPNKVRQTVLLGDVLPAAKTGPLQMALGRDVEGHDVVSNLAEMPHLLIGGTTGSGKSVSINCMIMSILMRATPAEVRMIMVDPKRVEFMPYNGIPHLYVPVVTEPKEAASALAWSVAEMERRLKVMSAAGARDIKQYNAKVHQGLLDEEDQEAQQLPYLVIIIDELADLMMNVGKDVEFSISRLAQLGRAAGIHLIVATQRPSTKVVTGLIKANITNRIAFNVASGIDSRVILDTTGAESLIGLGDMLLSKPTFAKPQRLQGCFVGEEEINAVVEHLKAQAEPEYHTEILKTNLMSQGTEVHGSNGSASNLDPLLWDAAEIVVGSKVGSTSNLQRRLQVGYSRAGRIMDMLEEKGIVGPANGSKPREVLVDELELETIKAFEQADGNPVDQ
jgi:S-DNA-T family DNA segregation ATPase FtsK/SpoIIIE